MIRKAIYPHIFKLQRITPLCKPYKDPLNIASYRPINNLISLAKLFDAHILECIITFLDQNEMIKININHHEGRKGF